MAWINLAFALEHSQKDGLFSMDIPENWHWVDYPQETIITYPDGQTVAIDIQWVASRLKSQDEIKKVIKEGNDKMVKDGIEAHQGTFIDEKEFKLDGVYATQLDFDTAYPNSVHVSYVSFFNEGYAFTITYGSRDAIMNSVMDDAVETIKLSPTPRLQGAGIAG